MAKAYISKYHVSSHLGDSISSFAKKNAFTPFQFYIGLLALYIFETQSLTELTIGVPNLNRGGKKYKDTIGMFVSVLPLNISYSKGMSFVELVEQISRRLKKSYRHAKYPLSEHAKRLEVVRSGRDRLFDIIFSYEEFEFSCQFGNAVLSETKQTFNPFSRYPLAISLCNFLDAKDIEMVIESGSKFFSQAESEWFGARLISLAEQLVVEHKSISDLAFCAPAELDLQIKQFERSLTKTDTESFAQNIINTSFVVPKNIALISDDIEVSYQQLVVSAAQVAENLALKNVQAGDSVILGLKRGPEVVVAMLACGLVGAIFVPIDLDWPGSRIASIRNQVGCTIACVNTDFERTILENNVIIDLPALMQQSYPLGELVKYNKVNFPTAYTLFTSGTTGQPKGVSVSHQALKHRLNWIVESWGVTSNDRALQATQINFDPSLIEMLVPLMAGGSVAFPKSGRLLPEWLPSQLIRFNATMMAFVPSTLTRFIDGLSQSSTLPLRICCCGGEVLSYEVAKRFCDATGAQLYNVYGPTEATIFCTSWHVHPQIAHTRNMPVGKAISNTQVIILNE
ncbi:AMP-binding protein, partial [Psychrosphaera sp.]|nr:AMP-binding protein [Psychrosphaera sp.]